MNEIITNGIEIKQRIIAEITNSKQFVYLAMAFFTDRDIANAIILAKSRNVSVDIILSSNVQNETVIQMFRDSNINVHAFNTGDERGLMHHKFCLIDNKITINGSYNYSYNASNNNVENIHISDDYDIYKQFLMEFEKIKYNIDNNIPVNTASPIANNMQQFTSTNPTESFSQQLHNLVYLSTQIDTEEYKNQGYEKSKESQGSTAIFKAEYINIKEQIRLFTVDDSLNSKKNVLSANITNAYENRKSEIDTDKQNELKIKENNFELDKRHLTDEISKLKEEKYILEGGNKNTNEKGLIQINNEIEKNNFEIKTLEESIQLKKFASLGSILVSIFLVICMFYLSIFFASALYKVFFESDAILAAREAGFSPQKTKIIDANAIINIFKDQGTLFGLISALIFLFPLALTNLKIIGSKNISLNKTCFWIGLVVFDILVSGMVAIKCQEIELLTSGGNQKLSMQFWEVIKQGEFYLIFAFGMLPLFITHHLIEYITNAYQNSKKELIDALKSRKIQVLKLEILNSNSIKNILLDKIKDINEKIKEKNERIIQLEIDLNNSKNQIESKFGELLKNAKSIFDDYISKIISGKIFTDVILESILIAFKTGFIMFLPEFYANNEVENRIREIDQIILIKI
jgi:hypothetical protein